MPSTVNLGPLISRFLFVDYFASTYFYVFHSCIPSPRLLSRSWVKVKRQSKLCEGQPLCHSAVRCCFVFRQLPYELAERNSTKTGHMLGTESDLKMHVRNLGYPLPTNRRKKHPVLTTLQLNGKLQVSSTLSQNVMNFGPQTA